MKFIWRLIRTILVLIGIGTVIYWAAQYTKTDSSMRRRVEEIKKSGIVKEGVKDMRTWAGEVFKDVGKEIQGDKGDKITDEERKKLDEIISKEAQGNNRR